MIKYRLLGQIGNQLTQYVCAKIIAEKSGLSYYPPQCFLDKQHRPVIWTSDPIFRMEPTHGKIMVGNPYVVEALQYIDFDQICKGDKPVAVRQLYGQTYSLFRDYKDRIRNDWLHIPEDRYVQTDDDAVYIHVRRTDYCEYHPDFVDPTNQGAATTLEEFTACLERFPDAKRIVVVTDDPSDEFHNGFARFGLPWSISGLAWDEDFILLASAKNLIISQSTYSWLAGFLGRAEKIVCPVFPGSFWHRGWTDNRYPHLYVDDDPDGRWTWEEVRNRA